MPRRPPNKTQKEIIKLLPDTPGVYLFYGPMDELLYVGKSKTIRKRVRSHFSTPEETRMCSQVTRIEARQTAGELGALLLESQLIKEMKPFNNRMSREKRRLIIARRLTTREGYGTVRVEAVNAIDPANTAPIMAIFKTHTQAKEFLAAIARSHRLCPRVLGLEKTGRFCFSYHLHQCDGACMGIDDPAKYNVRFESAFEERRIKAWPYNGGVLIEERTKDGEETDLFMIDHWCLLYSVSYGHSSNKLNIGGPLRFDYDSYKILATYLLNESNKENIRHLKPEEFKTLLKEMKAA